MFHEYVINGRRDAVNPAAEGTKVAVHCVMQVPAGGKVTLRLRLCDEVESSPKPFDESFERIFAERIREADEFYASRLPERLTPDERRVARQNM